jgi:antitoxin VapB
MPLNIKNEHAHELARELADLSDTTITEAVTTALQEAVERRRSRRNRTRNMLIEELKEIADRTASLPVYDHRSAEEILGYDSSGVPGA